MRKILKMLTLSLAVLSLMMTFIACGKKTDKETASEILQNTEDNEASNVTTVKAENEDTIKEVVDLAESNIDVSKIKSVIIFSGNTGESVELGEEDISEVIEKINSMEFTNIESELYTGWEYNVKITYEDDSSIDMVITGNEMISCTIDGETVYYKTEGDIVQLAENYYKKYN